MIVEDFYTGVEYLIRENLIITQDNTGGLDFAIPDDGHKYRVVIDETRLALNEASNNNTIKIIAYFADRGLDNPEEVIDVQNVGNGTITTVITGATSETGETGLITDNILNIIINTGKDYRITASDRGVLPPGNYSFLLEIPSGNALDIVQGTIALKFLRVR